MKVAYIIGIVVVIFVIIFGLFFYQPNDVPSPNSKNESCAKEGEAAFLSSGPPFKDCCEDLVEIAGGDESHWENVDKNSNGVIDDDEVIDGGFTMCSDCGNGICESWEHRYNCPEDCQ